MNFTVLNLSRDEWMLRMVNIVSKETFDAAIVDFPDKARYDAANLAAHNWDVVLMQTIQDFCIFIGSPRSGGNYYYKNGSIKVVGKGDLDIFYPIVNNDDHLARDVCLCYENGKTIYRKDHIDLSSFGEAGRRFMLMSKALKMYYDTLKYMPWVDHSGQPFDEERKKKRFKNKLQWFWDELNKDH